MINPIIPKGLYPDPRISKRMDESIQEPVESVSRTIVKASFVISTFLTLCVASFIGLVGYFVYTVSATFDAILALPIIVMSLLAWVWFLSMSLIITSKLLYEIAVNNIVFFGLYLLYIAPSAQLLYNLVNHNFSNEYVAILVFIAALFIENIISIPIVVSVMSNERLSKNAKFAWQAFLMIFCIIVTLINIFYR